MPRNPPPRLDRQLCFAIYSANLAITATYKPILEALGLTYPQYVVMLSLWEHDGPSVLQLAERVHMEAGTLSPILKRLEAAGLVSRTRAREDERRVHISVAPEGQALGKRAHQASQDFGAACALADAQVANMCKDLFELRDKLVAKLAPDES